MIMIVITCATRKQKFAKSKTLSLKGQSLIVEKYHFKILNQFKLRIDAIKLVVHVIINAKVAIATLLLENVKIKQGKISHAMRPPHFV